MLDLYGKTIVIKPRCKHCGKREGEHKAATLHCPVGKGRFPCFHRENVYEPKVNKLRANSQKTSET